MIRRGKYSRVVSKMMNEDDAELRERLTRLLNSLESSRDQNPATLEALRHVFPELAKTEKPERRPLIAKLKQWLAGRKAA